MEPSARRSGRAPLRGAQRRHARGVAALLALAIGLAIAGRATATETFLGDLDLPTFGIDAGAALQVGYFSLQEATGPFRHVHGPFVGLEGRLHLTAGLVLPLTLSFIDAKRSSSVDRSGDLGKGFAEQHETELQAFLVALGLRWHWLFLRPEIRRRADPFFELGLHGGPIYARDVATLTGPGLRSQQLVGKLDWRAGYSAGAGAELPFHPHFSVYALLRYDWLRISMPPSHLPATVYLDGFRAVLAVRYRVR